MLTPDGTRLAVWGDPVAHSLSPQLHSAAYRVLGLDWTYERRQVTESAFDAELAGLSTRWRGLSLTMPLKGAAHAAAAWRDSRSELTGAVNTLLLAPDGARGFNTDVGGIVRALHEEGIVDPERARIIGAGATAKSALVALGELGVPQVEVVARRPAAVIPLAELGATLGIEVVGVGLEAPRFEPVPVSIATLPGDAPITDQTADALAEHGGVLLDVVYGHWPTSLAHAWRRSGRHAASGRGMLLHQALLQVRIFAGGDPDTALPHEADVLAAMRLALVGD
jgi:shikimate dehydrogenase